MLHVVGPAPQPRSDSEVSPEPATPARKSAVPAAATNLSAVPGACLEPTEPKTGLWSSTSCSIAVLPANSSASAITLHHSQGARRW